MRPRHTTFPWDLRPGVKLGLDSTVKTGSRTRVEGREVGTWKQSVTLGVSIQNQLSLFLRNREAISFDHDLWLQFTIRSQDRKPPGWCWLCSVLVCFSLGIKLCVYGGQKPNHTFLFLSVLGPSNCPFFIPSLLQLQWKQDLDKGLELISKAIEIDNKCDFAYETMGTIEVQR